MHLRINLIAAFLTLVSIQAQAAEIDSFPDAYDTQAMDLALSTPEAALASIRLPPGFHATLFAAEPDVRQPIAMTFDERGRMWVAENYTYAEREVNYAADQRDRIVIFEDSDGDGRADGRKVFWDAGQKLTSIEVGFGGVWATCAPNLLFIPDRDRDDVPDGEPVVVLDGFEADAIRHNIVNGLRWGPDGWLYGRHGIQATSLVGKPGASASQRTAINCSIWRYHPTRTVFELVASGTTNPWGFDYDDHGEMFMINTVIGHLWHVVPGAHYRRMYGADLNPHVYQLLEQTADHFHWDTREHWNDVEKGMTDTTSQAGGGHAHVGLMIYLGDNWPRAYRGALFTINMHGHRINQDRLERQGAAYAGRHAADLAFWGDPWFRGVELTYGPDGGVYVLDWSDVGECHENDGVHRTSGRIYKLAYSAQTSEPRPTSPATAFDLASLGDAELADLQLHENDWYVRQARRLLQQRAAAGTDITAARAKLDAIYNGHADVTRKLRAMWCLYSIGATDDAWLTSALDDPDEHIRSWAVRLLVDRGEPSPAVMATLAAQAAEESSGLVRLYLASAMQKLPPADRWPIAMALVQHEDLADDPVLPLMIWYGIEPAAAADAEHGTALVASSRVPLVRRLVSRRLTEQLEEQPEAAARLVELAGKESDDAVRRDILSGMSEALRGWLRAEPPASWSGVSAELAKSSDEEIRRLAQELSVVFGDGRAADELRAVATDAEADPATRRQAIRLLVQSRQPDLADVLKRLVADRVVGNEAVQGLAAYDDPETPRVVINVFGRLSLEGRAAALNTLASRPEYARALLAAVANGRIARGEIMAYHARQIQSFGNDNLTRELAKVWGEVRATAEDKLKLLAEHKERLSPSYVAEGDLSRGRALFNKTCAACHVLFGQGRTVGPDLTGSNRKNLDYLLENIVDPSAQVAADFRVSIVVLADGRVINGVITHKTDRTITIETQQEPLVVDVSEIDEIQPTSLSLMPEGILNPLGQDEIRDLMAYLMSSTQAALPQEAAGN